MIKWIIILPLISILINRYIRNDSIIKLYTMFIYIVLLYLSYYIYIFYNNNSFEFQERYTIDIGGYRYSIGIDGISISLIILLNIIYPIIIWIVKDKGIYNKLHIIYIVIIFIFISLDILIFFIFFELILLPMFLLIGIYGSKYKRIEASYRFLLFTYLGSIFMLISLLYIYILNGSTNIEYNTYKIKEEVNQIYNIINILILISFLIKLPIFPFHIWLPIVHVESPTIGSVLLASILLKLATYGIYRINITMFNKYNNYMIIPILILIIISIYYISIINIKEIDLKKIIAYSSIVHMNFTLSGLVSNDINGLYGALFSNISHGIISSALFLLIGILYIRYHTRILFYLNDLANYMPIYSFFFFLFILHNIGIPTSSSFISELYIFFSSYKINVLFSILLLISLLFSTIYNISLVNRLLFNPNIYITTILDLSINEFLILFNLLFFSFLLGIFPSPLLTIFTNSILLSLY